MQKYEKKQFPPRKKAKKLRKEEITDENSRYHARYVSAKATSDCIAIAPDAYASKIDCENIKRGIGATLKNAGQMSHERVRPVMAETIEHHSTRRRSAERFHERHGQSPHEVTIDAHLIHHCH